MAKPTIVREQRHDPPEKEPPGPDRAYSHDWLDPDSMEEFREVLASGLPFDLYMSSLAAEKMKTHALEEAPRRLEVMGFLLGEVDRWQGRTYALVREVVTTTLKSSPAKVRFDPEAFPKLFGEMDKSGFDYIIVGWYHSHPGHTCFLSKTDLETQRTMFNQPYHVAIVIDPLNEDIKAFKLSGSGYNEVPFALYSPSEQERGRISRKRKLKQGQVRTG